MNARKVIKLSEHWVKRSKEINSRKGERERSTQLSDDKL